MFLKKTGKFKTCKGKKENQPTVPLLTLFRYSTRCERLRLLAGIKCALIFALATPLMTVFKGHLLDSFMTIQGEGNNCITNPDNITENRAWSSIPEMFTTEAYINITDQGRREIFMDNCRKVFYIMMSVGMCQFALGALMQMALCTVANRQVFYIQKAFVDAVLRQDMAWFDLNNTRDFANKVTNDLCQIKEAIGETLLYLIFNGAASLFSIATSIYYGWELALILLALTPVPAIVLILISRMQVKICKEELDAYSNAGAVAEEAFSSIRTVAAFGGEKKEIRRYKKELLKAKKKGCSRIILTSTSVAILWFFVFASIALAFWFGSHLVLDSRCTPNPKYKPGNFLIVFTNVWYSVLISVSCVPHAGILRTAKVAAASVFDVIDRPSKLDGCSKEGAQPSQLTGKVTFKDVGFSYPARAAVPVLRNFSVEVMPGEMVALVGSSGSGKSTVIKLLKRFYDVDAGEIQLDGRDIRDLNVGWLRNIIGVVSQEPVLFSGSVAENIRYGKMDATEDEVIRAAMAANAHDFIIKLPLKYRTVVGERGTQLSGGQKQRVAIARALVRNPRILLLDEATSALDARNESLVQTALDKARCGRTTLVIAHRLSTIKNADKIVAMDNGEIREIGTHDQLMEQKGLYHQLLVAQQEASLNVKKKEKMDKDVDPEVWNETVASTKSSNSEVVASFRSSLKKLKRMGSFKSERGERGSLLGNKTEKDQKTVSNPSQFRLLKLSAPEWPCVLIGCIACILQGLFIPAYGLYLGNILGSLGLELKEAKRSSNLYSVSFMGVAVLFSLVSFFQHSMMNYIGDQVTFRIRKAVFTKLVTQDMSWFDDPQNGTGALCTRLSKDASQIKLVSGGQLGTILQSFSTLCTSIFIALYYNWKIGAVVFSFVPVLVVCNYASKWVTTRQEAFEKSSAEKASKILVEAIENVHTVASLHAENVFKKNFEDIVSETLKSSTRITIKTSLTSALFRAMMSFAYAISLYYGSVLIYNKELSYGDLFKLLEAIILGTLSVAQAVDFAPQYHKAQAAVAQVFDMLDKPSKISPFSTSGKLPEGSQGCLELREVSFSYPCRSKSSVFCDMSFAVKPGQTVALVGASGSGKSTTVQLLERFYDVVSGQVLFDDVDVRDLNVSWLRSQVGLVSQEPVLFNYSIAENIAYGDNTRKDVPMEEIIDAARKANIHGFIENLPAGYQTSVGDRGTRLSGGQKQRIAIARALLRNPKVLLLDEATSALDTESEKILQETLDKARVGRTCIVIAHRLTTIQNADQILVIKKGRIVEKGNHEELLTKRGVYYKLHATQGET